MKALGRGSTLLVLLCAVTRPGSAAVPSKAAVEAVVGLRLWDVGRSQPPAVDRGLAATPPLSPSLSIAVSAPASRPDLKPAVGIAAPFAQAPAPPPASAVTVQARPSAQSADLPFPSARGAPKAQAELPSDVAAFLAQAKSAPDAHATREFLASLPARFDGMSREQRGAVLEGLEAAAKAARKEDVAARTHAEKAVLGADALSRLASRKPDAVLFDWDNTLVDERGTVDAVRMRLFGELGVPTPTPEEANRIWRTDRDGFYDRFFPGVSRDTVNKTYYSIMERVRRERERSGQPLNPLLPGVRETLGALKRAGVPVAVVSNKPHEQLVRELRILGLEGAFAYVQGHAEGRELKPSAQPLAEAMKKLGVAGGDVWYVGDELSDMAAAKAAGAQGVFFGTRDADKAADAPRVADHLQFGERVLKKLP